MVSRDIGLLRLQNSGSDVVGCLFTRGLCRNPLTISFVRWPRSLLALKVAKGSLMTASASKRRRSRTTSEARLRTRRRRRPLLGRADGNVVALRRVLRRQLGDFDRQDPVFQGAFYTRGQIGIFRQAQGSGEIACWAFQHSVGARSHQRRHSFHSSSLVILFGKGQLRIPHSRNGQGPSLHIEFHLVFFHSWQIDVDFPATRSFQHVCARCPLVFPVELLLMLWFTHSRAGHPIPDAGISCHHLFIFFQVVRDHVVPSVVVFVTGMWEGMVVRMRWWMRVVALRWVIGSWRCASSSISLRSVRLFYHIGHRTSFPF